MEPSIDTAVDLSEWAVERIFDAKRRGYNYIRFIRHLGDSVAACIDHETVFGFITLKDMRPLEQAVRRFASSGSKWGKGVVNDVDKGVELLFGPMELWH